MDGIRSARAHRGGLPPYLKFIGVTLAIAALQIAGGFRHGSLALISDAVGHAPIHLAAAGLAIASYRLASRRTEVENHRREVGVRKAIAGLIFLSGLRIAWEALERLEHPAAVDGWWVLAIAALGLLGNFYQGHLLRECDCEPDLALRDDVRSDIVMSGAVVVNGGAIGLGAPVSVDSFLSLAAVVWIVIIAVRLFLGKHAH